MAALRIGLEVLRHRPDLAKDWGTCALLSNQASVSDRYEPAYQICHRILSRRLVALFGPQHGFWGTAQDNMIETAHERMPGLDIPVYSLYAEIRQPTAEMLDGIDTLIVDIQVVGCRIYTFKATISACLRAAKQREVRVVILDRPNPLGGTVVEGRCPDADMLSFVAPDHLPMRHGLSVGEAAKFFNRNIGARLEVVPMEGWHSAEDFRATGRDWVLTSPNLPTLAPVFIYPGMVLFEGTNVSEGRGTGLPFQFIGAPFLRPAAGGVVKRVNHYGPQLRGVFLREACFQPTSGKWQGQVCYGVQLHPQEPQEIASFSLALALMRAIADLGGDEFCWKQPPYEYEFDKLPIEVIMGSQRFREHFAAFNLADPFWQEGVADYLEEVAPYVIYRRTMRLAR